jgi:copper transport protein
MKKCFLLIIGSLLFFNASQAWAHAVPVEYTPASSSVVQAAPKEIHIRFSERIEQSASSITIFAPDGSSVDVGTDAVDENDAHIFSATMSGSLKGTYAVSWQVTSADDGHFTKGGFIFSIGTTSDNALASGGQLQIRHRSGWPEAIMLWLELLGEAILLAAVVMISMVLRKIRLESPPAFMKRLSTLIFGAGIIIVIGAIGYLLLKSSQLSADQGVRFFSAVIAFMKTVAGRYTVYRLVISLIVCGLFLHSLSSLLASKKIVPKEILLVLLILVVDLFRAQVSHAAASEFLPQLSIFVNFVHLIFKDLWIGGLVVFVAAYVPVLQKSSRMVEGLAAFSRLVILSMIVGGLSGLYILWLHLKSPANLFTTHWGGYFMLLAGYAIILLTIRLYEELVVFLALAKTDERSKDIAAGAGVLLLMETITGIAILFFSSILIITTPPLSPQSYFSEHVSTPEAIITFGEHPYEESQFLVTVDRTKAMTGGILTITLENKEKNIGPIIATTEQRSEHGYVFPKSTLSPPGLWTVSVTEQKPEAFDAVASFTVNYPFDIDTVHAFDEKRSIGGFEIGLIVIAFLIVTLTAYLYRRNLFLMTLHSTPFGSLTIQRPWMTIPIVLILLALPGLGLGGQHGNSALVRDCKKTGGVWHESVPMRDGIVTSHVAVLGCMIGMGEGTFHFADSPEFSYFTRRIFSFATLETDPPLIVPGKKVNLLFNIQAMDGNPVEGLTREHDRILHTIVVSQDLQTFSHLHVEDTGHVDHEMVHSGVFPVRYTFPRLGRYLVGVDYTVRSQTFADDFIVSVQDANTQKTSKPDFTREKTFTGMIVKLSSGKLTAGVPGKLTYTFMENGKPVKDLHPYLSAAMHLSVVKTDLRKFVHTHAELPQSVWDSIVTPRDPYAKHAHVFLPESFGPKLVAYVVFPVEGTYEIFGEVNRGGKIVLTRFTVEVEPQKK